MFSFNMLAYFLLYIQVQFNPCEIIILLKIFWGHAVAQLVEALRYKPEGHGFDSR